MLKGLFGALSAFLSTIIEQPNPQSQKEMTKTILIFFCKQQQIVDEIRLNLASGNQAAQNPYDRFLLKHAELAQFSLSLCAESCLNSIALVLSSPGLFWWSWNGGRFFCNIANLTLIWITHASIEVGVSQFRWTFGEKFFHISLPALVVSIVYDVFLTWYQPFNFCSYINSFIA